MGARGSWQKQTDAGITHSIAETIRKLWRNFQSSRRQSKPCPSVHFKPIHQPQNVSMLTTGELGEKRALDYLSEHKLTLVQKNYRCLFGEIDLIMRDQDCLVFVEVKRRKHNRYGSPLEMVSVKKQEKLRRTAQHYINQHKLSQQQQAMRFDVIGIVADATRETSVDWIQNAF
jgi:putative endonuclease